MNQLVAAITALFESAVALTPLAIIGLLVGVLYVQIWKQPSKRELETVRDNHLHELPIIAANTTAMAESLRRIESQQTEKFAEIVTRLDVKGR